MSARHFSSIATAYGRASLADTTISRLHQEPRGKRKSVRRWLSAPCTSPGVARFHGPLSDLTVDLTISDRRVDLADEGYDIALRITREPGQNLVARQLAPILQDLREPRLPRPPRYFLCAPEDLS